jgi:hypothetical protein
LEFCGARWRTSQGACLGAIAGGYTAATCIKCFRFGCGKARSPCSGCFVGRGFAFAYGPPEEKAGVQTAVRLAHRRSVLARLFARSWRCPCRNKCPESPRSRIVEVPKVPLFQAVGGSRRSPKVSCEVPRESPSRRSSTRRDSAVKDRISHNVQRETTFP